MSDASKSPPYYCHGIPQTKYTTYSGLTAQGQLLQNSSSSSEGVAACTKRADCFMVSQMPGKPVALYGGGGAPGSLSEQAPAVYNLTAKGMMAPAQVWVKQASPSTEEECLMSAAAADLIATNMGAPFGDTFETDGAAPTVDGVELPSDLASLARAAALPEGMEVLGGSNLDEGTEFMSLTPALACNATEADFREWAIKKYGAELGAKVPDVYRQTEAPYPVCQTRHWDAQQPKLSDDGDQSAWVAAMRSAGDSAILCRVREILRGADRMKSQSWSYLFTATPLYSINMGNIPSMGAFHGAEVPFVFGDQFELKSDGERWLSQAMGCYWRNFATSGNPNVDAAGNRGCVEWLKLPAWPAAGGEGDALQLSNTTIQARPALYKSQCDLFLQYP